MSSLALWRGMALVALGLVAGLLAPRSHQQEPAVTSSQAGQDVRRELQEIREAVADLRITATATTVVHTQEAHPAPAAIVQAPSDQVISVAAAEFANTVASKRAWTTDDRDRLREMMPTLSASERRMVLTTLAAAVNRGELSMDADLF